MIAIINYGLGNVQAFANIYKRLGVPARIASCNDELIGASKIILPGVGAFDWAMHRLNQSGMREALDDIVGRKGCPALGVCVGMQMMARRSDEGELKGLGWIDGDVRKLQTSSGPHRTMLPHMGWNEATPILTTPLFRGLEEGARFYFLHSYYFAPDRSDNILATTDYHGRYASGVGKGGILGVQFHPEKSHHWGITLLKNFAGL